MSHTRQIYNIWSLGIGPAPSTGYHFENYNSEGINTPELTLFDSNRIKQIDRVQDFTYNFNIDRTNLSHLGQRSLIDRVIVNRPPIQVNFSYLIAGIRNEDRLGLVVNYPDVTNTPINTGEICCFKNFTGWETDARNIFLSISPDYNDLNERIGDNLTSGPLSPKDLYVFGFGNCYFNSYSVNAAVGQFPRASIGYICDNVMGYASGSGMNIPAVYPKSGNLVTGPRFTIPHADSIITPSVLKPSDITLQIIQDTVPNSFDYLYLYNIQTSLYNKIQLSGEINNETFLISNGVSNPTGNIYSGIYIKNLTDNSYNRLLGTGIDGNQDIVVYSGINNPTNNFYNFIYMKNIVTNNYGKINTSGLFSGENVVINSNLNPLAISYPVDAYFGINSSGAPIQSFDISVQLDREDLRSIGYVLPIDRRVNFPIFADINLSTIVNDNVTGNLIDKLNRNESYDILINMYNPRCPGSTGQIGAQYKIKNAKFVKTDYNYNIGNNLIANFGFQAEIDVDNAAKGLFISGLLNAPFPEFPYNYLVLENNKTGLVLLEDGNPIIIANAPE